MNSSNVNVTRDPEKFRVESPGVTLTNTGGSESLGPPSGGIILAQPEVSTASFPIRIKQMQKRMNLFIGANIVGFRGLGEDVESIIS